MKNTFFRVRHLVVPVFVAIPAFAGLAPNPVFAQDAAADVSDADAAQIADAQLSVIEASITEGQDLLSQARTQSDVSRIDCINTQLVIARGFLNVAQNANTNLKEAISRSDADAVAHHRKLLDLASEKTGASVERMKQCSAGVLSIAGETKSTAVRTCKVEPCLEGETVYAPEKIQAQSATGADIIDVGGSVDASPYM